ncbi:MAG: leucine-rich repeat protein [Bacteroidaceae bacterium]|nr:leucine-rich repeat protein [Bacteroidaceae bacterium]
MKKFREKLNRLFLLLVIMTCSTTIFAQERGVLNVHLEKPGQLKKVLKKAGKKDVLSITRLKISGQINEKDVEHLRTMTNLVHFDASEVQEDYSTPKIDLSVFTKLKYLNPSKRCMEISAQLDTLVIPRFSDRRDPYKYSQNFIKVLYIEEQSEMERKSLLLKEESFGKVRYAECQDRRIKVDLLYLPDSNGLKYSILENFDPCCIMLQKEKKVILNHWHESDKQSTADLSGFAYIMPFAFSGIKNVVKIECPENITEIPDYAFYGCTNLKEVDFKAVQKVGKMAFKGTKVQKVTFPSTLTEISDCTFLHSNIKSVEFLGLYPPTMKDDIEDDYWKEDMIGIEFHIPENTYDSYYLGFWKKVLLTEKGRNTAFEILVDSPGTVEQYLSNEIRTHAKKLTVKGVLYDTDFEKIKECKYVQVLDLSHTFITKSPETIKKEREELNALDAILSYGVSLAKANSENQYNLGLKSTLEHEETTLGAEFVRELVLASESQNVQPNSNCIIPSGFAGWAFIKEIILPLQLTEVGRMGGCDFLEKVVIPEGANQIYGNAFFGCENLKTVNFPATLEYIGPGAFAGCVSLSQMDLSHTKIKKLDDIFYDSDSYTVKREINLEIFKAPQGLTYFRSHGGSKVKQAYFYTREAPEKLYSLDVEELYIPKGSRAGWNEVMNRSEIKKVIEY